MNDLERDFLLSFCQMHILHRADSEAVGAASVVQTLRRRGCALALGQVEPLLMRMEALGLLHGQLDADAGPRARRHYHLTEAGRGALRELRDKLAIFYDEIVRGQEDD